MSYRRANNHSNRYHSQMPPSQRDQEPSQRSRSAGPCPRPSSFGQGGPFDNRAHRERNSFSNISRQRNNQRPYNKYHSGARNSHHKDAYVKEKDEPHEVRGNDGRTRQQGNNHRYFSQNSYRPHSQSNNYSNNNRYNNRNSSRSDYPGYVRDSPRQGRQSGEGEGNRETEDDSTINWGPKRRATGNVRGGRIAKKRRTEEFAVDEVAILRCDICDLNFRDFAEKIAHDESRDHLNNKEQRRGEIMQQQEHGWGWDEKAIDPDGADDPDEPDIPYNKDGNVQPVVPTRTTSTSSGSVQGGVGSINALNEPDRDEKEDTDATDPVDSLIIQQASSLLAESTKIPESFKSWANKSLLAAKEKSERNKDPGIFERVQKEISFELVRHTEYCTLHRYDWNRQLLCTGSMMEKKNKSLSTKMMPLDQLLKMDALAKQRQLEKERVAATNETRADNRAGNGSYDPPRNENQSTYSAHSRATRRSVANAPHVGNTRETGQYVPAPVTNPSSSIGPASSIAPVTSIAADTTIDQDLELEIANDEPRRLHVHRRPPAIITERVRMLTIFSMDLEPSVVMENHALRSKGIPRSCNDEVRKVNISEIKKKLYSIAMQLANRQFPDTDSLRTELHRMASELEAADTHPHLVQKCIKLELNIAHLCSDYNRVPEPAAKLMKSFSDHGCDESPDDDVALDSELSITADVYIAMFLLSLLLRGEAKSRMLMMRAPGSKQPFSRMLSEAMRLLPKGALQMDLVRISMDAFKALISNDWVSFFRLHNDAMSFHDYDSDHLGMTNNMFGLYSPYVRERVCMTTLTVPIGGVHAPYDPPLISIGDLMDFMGFPQKPEDEDLAGYGYDGDAIGASRDQSLEEARTVIKNLPRKLQLLGEESEGRHMMVRGSRENTAVHNSSVVNVPLLNMLIGNKTGVEVK